MKQKLLLIVLAVGVFTIYAHSQTDVLRTEKDGFQWFKNYDIDGSVGASSKDGNIIISTKIKIYFFLKLWLIPNP